jgi:hypothetical protein
MKRTILTACVLAVMSGGVSAWQSTAQAPAAVPGTHPAKNASAVKAKTSSRKKAKVEVPQPLPAQEMPPLPATLMNSAPVKPSVTLDGGQLTIDAPNSTLSDVLNGVRKATGASIEGAVPTERVAVKLGPGNPEQVLAALLRGTPYDYVILGALGKPDVVTRVMLTQQSSQTSSASSGAPQAPAGAPAPPRGYEPHRQLTEEEVQAEQTPPDDTAAAPPENVPAPAPPAPQAQPDANQPKTPEQLFKELQLLNQPKPQE